MQQHCPEQQKPTEPCLYSGPSFCLGSGLSSCRRATSTKMGQQGQEPGPEPKFNREDDHPQDFEQQCKQGQEENWDKRETNKVVIIFEVAQGLEQPADHPFLLPLRQEGRSLPWPVHPNLRWVEGLFGQENRRVFSLRKRWTEYFCGKGQHTEEDRGPVLQWELCGVGLRVAEEYWCRSVHGKTGQDDSQTSEGVGGDSEESQWWRLRDRVPCLPSLTHLSIFRVILAKWMMATISSILLYLTITRHSIKHQGLINSYLSQGYSSRLLAKIRMNLLLYYF